MKQKTSGRKPGALCIRGGQWVRAWIYDKTQVTVPELTGTYTYIKNVAQTVSISTYDSSLISQSGTTKATNHGTYTVTFTLKDTRKYCWPDGTTEPKDRTWTIDKRSLTIPSVSGTYTYNSSYTRSCTISNFDSTYETKSGTESAKNAGTYYVYFDLSDTANTQWSDGTTTQKSKSWVINRANLTIPTVKSAKPSYTGNIIYLSNYLDNYNSTYEELSGEDYAVGDGNYTGYVSITNSNYQWSDGTTTRKTLSWTINKASLTIPRATTNPTYTGKTIYIDDYLANFDSTKESITGSHSGINAGQYSARINITNSHYQWSDGTTASKSLTWYINQADGYVQIAQDGWVDKDDDHRQSKNTTSTWSITGNSGGIVTFNSIYDSGVSVNYSVSGNYTDTCSISITTPSNFGSGDYVYINYEIAETTNYKALSNMQFHIRGY